MEEKHEYSIIIPHYKSVDLLSRCILSIPSRKDIQVIVVDDNSGYSKDALLQKCPELYNVLLVMLTEKNKGAGHARNEGLKRADGKWLLFADADDFYTKQAFSLCDQYKNSDFDIIYFGIRSIDNETGAANERYRTYNSYVEACDNNNIDSIDKLKFRHDVPWGKMIRHSMVVKYMIYFDETRYCNDTMFSTKCALAARKVFSDQMPFYCVTSTSGSLTTHTSLEAYTTRYEVILRKNKLLRESGYARYQMSVIYYLLKFLNFGIYPFLRGVKLGVKYHANFFIGSSLWCKKIFKRIRNIIK